jgi:hypothetical protein
MINLKLTGDNIEFTYHYTKYTKDTKLRDMINKAFGGNAVSAWSSEKVTKVKGDIDFGAGSIILLLPDGTTTQLQSSEWASIEYGTKL